MSRSPARPLRAPDLPPADADPVELLAWLAAVDADQLSPVLATLWGSSKTSRKAQAARRLSAWAHADALRAAAARSAVAPRQADVPALVHELLASNPRWSKTRAFEHIAGQRRVAMLTVRNGYYAHRRRDVG